MYPAYQQPVQYNLAVAREVLKHVYTAERLQPPTSLSAVFGTYGTLWARARSLGYWREVVRSGEYAHLGVYALEAYGIFKVCFVFFTPVFPLCLFVRGLIVLCLVAGWRDRGAYVVRRVSRGVELGAWAVPSLVVQVASSQVMTTTLTVFAYDETCFLGPF